jgi:hypothetical protein
MREVKSRPLTEKEINSIHNRKERLFALNAHLAGFAVLPGRPIESPKPVADRWGFLKKRKTVPDFEIIDPQSHQTWHIEVTNGRGKNNHKLAQQNVAIEAGKGNYMQVTGREIDFIDLIPLNKKRIFMQILLGLRGPTD